MPTNTADQQIPIPANPDLAANPSAMTSMVAPIESRLVRRYTTAADQAARDLAPVAGQISHQADTGRVHKYNGSALVSLSRHSWWDFLQRASDAVPVNNSVTLGSDAILKSTLLTGATYMFDGRIYYDSSVTADFKLAFLVPTFSFFKWGLTGRQAATATNFDPQVATTSDGPLIAGGNAVGTATFCDFSGHITTTAAGDLQTRYAQGTLDATNTTVRSGSWLRVIRIA